MFFSFFGNYKPNKTKNQTTKLEKTFVFCLSQRLYIWDFCFVCLFKTNNHSFRFMMITICRISICESESFGRQNIETRWNNDKIRNRFFFLSQQKRAIIECSKSVQQVITNDNNDNNDDNTIEQQPSVYFFFLGW